MLRKAVTTVAFALSVTQPAFADILWGANGHPVTAYPGISIRQQFDFLEDLGLRSYRVNVVDQSSGDVLADLVREGRARGISILPVITPGVIDLDEDSTEELYARSYDLAWALASRFKDDIRVWELGNEMENHAIIQPCELRDDRTVYPCEWGPAGGVHELDYYGPRWTKVSAVLKGLSDGISAVDPDLKKAMGTAGWGHLGAFTRMERDGIGWDISVWHLYGEDPEWAFKELVRFDRPIWVTEFNNPLGSHRSDEHQTSGLRQLMFRLKELHGAYRVEAAHIYELLDEPYLAPSFEADMGLVRLTGSTKGGWRPGEPKPAYAVVRAITVGTRPLPQPERECDIRQPDRGPLPLRQARFAYCLVLGRAADGNDDERWAATIADGSSSFAEMIVSLLNSDEFRRKYATFALSDRAYVGFLYRLILLREADIEGFETYARQLARGSMTREDVAYGMVDSSEFRALHRAYILAGERGGILASDEAVPATAQ